MLGSDYELLTELLLFTTAGPAVRGGGSAEGAGRLPGQAS